MSKQILYVYVFLSAHLLTITFCLKCYSGRSDSSITVIDDASSTSCQSYTSRSDKKTYYIALDPGIEPTCRSLASKALNCVECGSDYCNFNSGKPPLSCYQGSSDNPNDPAVNTTCYDANSDRCVSIAVTSFDGWSFTYYGCLPSNFPSCVDYGNDLGQSLVDLSSGDTFTCTSCSTSSCNVPTKSSLTCFQGAADSKPAIAPCYGASQSCATMVYANYKGMNSTNYLCLPSSYSSCNAYGKRVVENVNQNGFSFECLSCSGANCNAPPVATVTSPNKIRVSETTAKGSAIAEYLSPNKASLLFVSSSTLQNTLLFSVNLILLLFILYNCCFVHFIYFIFTVLVWEKNIYLILNLNEIK